MAEIELEYIRLSTLKDDQALIIHKISARSSHDKSSLLHVVLNSQSPSLFHSESNCASSKNYIDIVCGSVLYSGIPCLSCRLYYCASPKVPKYEDQVLLDFSFNLPFKCTVY